VAEQAIPFRELRRLVVSLIELAEPAPVARPQLPSGPFRLVQAPGSLLCSLRPSLAQSRTKASLLQAKVLGLAGRRYPHVTQTKPDLT
jgi:hypothetical protein